MMNRGNSALAQATVPQVIFIAFDSRELDAAQARGLRNMVIMLGAAALVIAATMLSQFWFRRYRRSRKQLLEAMARKEKLVALGHLAAGSRMRSAIRCLPLKGWRNILPNALRLAAKRIN
jgi:two-component system sensor histidine kinase HydH